MITIGVLTDLHYADKEARGKRKYRESLPRFLRLAGVFKECHVAKVLQLGDAIEDGWDNLMSVAELFRLSGLPIQNVLGNHDFMVPDAHIGQVHEALKLDKSGYSSCLLEDKTDPNNQWRFIFINGLEISDYSATNPEEYALANKTREKYRLTNGKLPGQYCGAVSQRQLKWLNQLLEEADQKNEHVVVCSHFPLFSRAGSISSISKYPLMNNLGLYFSDMGVSIWNGRAILAILDQHSSVKAYFAGHLHQGGYGLRKNIHHVTFRGIIESVEAYAIVSFHPDRIEIKGFGDEPNRSLKF